jgi:hypothetical protein
VDYQTTHTSLAITNTAWVRAHGRWFSPDTPASSTTKTDRHDIAEILLKVALSTINQSIIFTRSLSSGYLFAIHNHPLFRDKMMNLTLTLKFIAF